MARPKIYYAHLCPTCFRDRCAPFRLWNAAQNKITEGCVDHFHTGHLVTPSASSDIRP